MKKERKDIIERHLREGKIIVSLEEGKVFYKSGKECTSVDTSGYYVVGIREGKKTYNYRVHEVRSGKRPHDRRLHDRPEG